MTWEREYAQQGPHAHVCVHHPTWHAAGLYRTHAIRVASCALQGGLRACLPYLVRVEKSFELHFKVWNEKL